MSVVSVMGAGSWGTALAILLSNNGHEVSVWSLFENEIEMLDKQREQKQNLPGVKIPKSIRFTCDIKESLKDFDYIVLAVPSQAVRSTAKLLAPYVNNNDIIIMCSKGFEEATGLTLCQVIKSEMPQTEVVALYGPSHAEEVAGGIPTTVVSASPNIEASTAVQDLFMSPTFRVYTSSDLIGAEIGAACKNIIALCAGISDGLGYGDNSKAALMTRGITEIGRLGIAMGAEARTFSGLTGIGDLIVTCTSKHSRNWRAGHLIAQGFTAQEAQNQIKMVVEGISASRAIMNLLEKYKVEMPICSQAYEILFNEKDCKSAVYELMTRSRKHESEDTGW